MSETEKISHINNKRIAKNTAALYFRTIFVMVVTLFTSRVILKALGVENYGIYQVVGGMVVMFQMISGALSAAISRFITFEIGKGNRDRLSVIFSTSVYVQLILSGIVLVLAEVVGIWFLQTQMQIPEGRLTAATWVLQFSLVSFCVSLLSVPYNACIIAHEHMKAFAYIGIFDALAKLGISYFVFISPIDKLVFYAALMMAEAVLVRYIYSRYCTKHFVETRKLVKFDKQTFKEIFGFAGWSFITSINGHLNNQGVSMLVNVFFGVVFNASRGIATQVESAIVHFVSSFTTAIKPQIIKSYAAGDIRGMATLVYRGAKFSYFAMLAMMLPIICETDIILHTWLTVVPDQTVIFVKLSLIIGTFDCVRASTAAACYATGKMKKYAIILGIIGLLEFPLTWVFFALGAPIVTTYYLYIFVKTLVLIASIYLLQDMVGLKMINYVKKVLLPIFLVTIVSLTPNFVLLALMAESYIRLVISLVIGVSSVGLSSFFLGLTKGERKAIMSKVKSFRHG